MIRKIANKDSAILLQNAFPILEKYIDHPHMLNGKPLKVVDVLKNEILDNFKYMIEICFLLILIKSKNKWKMN